MGILYVLIVIAAIFIFAGCYDVITAKDRKNLRDDHERHLDYVNYKD